MNLIRAMRVVATCWSRRLEVIRFGLANLRKYYPRLKRNFPVNFLLTMIFTMLAMAVMGYHPGFEDDGIYLSAIKKRLNPALYPHDADFFRFQLQATVFDNWMAGFVRWTHIPLAWAELFWQVASIALILYGCWRIARRLFPEARAQWAGVAMVAAMLTLPVAGTELYLVGSASASAHHGHGLHSAGGRASSGQAQGASGAAAGAGLSAASDHGRAGRILLHLSLRWLLSREQCGAVLPASLAQETATNVDGRAAASARCAAFIPLGWVFDPPNPLWRESVSDAQRPVPLPLGLV